MNDATPSRPNDPATVSTPPAGKQLPNCEGRRQATFTEQEVIDVIRRVAFNTRSVSAVRLRAQAAIDEIRFSKLMEAAR